MGSVMSHFSKILLSLAILISSVQLSGQTHQNWNVVFPTSETSEAQQHFLDGVTNMHLHMFEDAERHFRQAQQLSPDFAMAYWGEALNNHRTIWSIHRLDEARAVLNRLGATPAARAAKAPTARGKSLSGGNRKIIRCRHSG